MTSTIDADQDLRLGKLVAPFGRGVMESMPMEQVPGFYLVIPRAHRRVRAVAAFCKWLEGKTWT